MIIVGLGSCIVLGLFLYYSSRDAMLSRTFDQLMSVRTEKENRLEKFFSDRLYDVQLMAEEEEIVEVFNMIEKRRTDDKSSIIHLKKSWMPYHGNEYFSRFYFVTEGDIPPYALPLSGDSLVLMPVNDEIKEDRLDSLNTYCDKDVCLLDLDKRDHPVGLRLLSPVYDGEEKTGTLMAVIPVSSINDIMYEDNPHNGLGSSGEAYLVGSDYLMRSTSRFKDNSVLSEEVNTPGVKRALNGKTGTDIFQDYRGIEVLSSYSHLSVRGIEWAVLAEIDFHEAMIPINNLRNKILFIGVGIGILVFVLAWFLSGWLSKPLVRLNRAASSIAEGKHPPQLAIKSKDEIGELTSSFNHMAAKIEEQKQNLRLSRYQSLRSMIDGQEKERQRLSRELHDSLGQMLIALKLKYQSACEDDSNPELLNLIDKTIEETRRMSGNLKPAELDEFGLKSAMQMLCQVQAELTGIEIELQVDILPEQIGDKAKVYLYRILQEGLNNVHKHAEAQHVNVLLKSRKAAVFMGISDDGRGFNPENDEVVNGFGISNMEDRVSLMSGRFSIQSAPGKGTQIRIEIPLNDMQ